MVVLSGYAIIQIPETALFWYGYVKNRWWNKISSTKETTKNHVYDDFEVPTQMHQNIVHANDIGQKPIQCNNTHDDETQNTASIERYGARMNNIERELQHIKFMIEKLTKIHENV